MTEDYILMETVSKKLGDFSHCSETSASHWKEIVLSGDIDRMSFGIARIKGDVESRLSVKYRAVAKCKFPSGG